MRGAPIIVAALALASCGGSSGASTPAGIHLAGKTIPKSTAPAPAKQPATVTTASGAPRVAQFKAPRTFWCLRAHPGQAQVTVGWSVPSATRVAVSLDGKRLHSGIRRELPFAVLAGTPSGIGATVVFGCEPAARHRVEIRWWAHGSPPAEREVTIAKATRR